MIYLFWLSMLWLLTVYVLYPLGIHVFKKIKQLKKPNPCPNKKTVTFIVPCFNEEENIVSKMRNCQELTHTHFNINFIFIDDASTDRTLQLLEKNQFLNSQIIYNIVGLGKTLSLQRASSYSSSDLLIFSDCAAQLNSQAIEALAHPFLSENTGLVTGVYSSVPSKKTHRSNGEGLYWKLEMTLRSEESDLQSTSHATGALYAVRRDLFQKIIIPEGIINDDLFLPLQIIEMGYNVKTANTARATEFVNTTVKNELSRRTRIAAGNFQMLSEIPSLLKSHRYFILFQLIFHKWLRNLGGIAIVLQILSLPFLIKNSFYLLPSLGWTTLMILCLLGFRRSAPKNKLSRLASLSFYFYLTN